jgi:uncharacterized membrane protein
MLLQGETHARRQGIAHFDGRRLVRRVVLPAAHFRQSGHGAADSVAERDRLLLMAGKLYRFMTPLGVLALVFGLWLWFGYGFSGGWLHAKTALVALLVIYHWHCGRLLKTVPGRRQ